uniref:Hypothetical secreted peptide n=1 Tax=Glossina morsitans morsitans TaxID=37546 RepID=D3TSQ2_GLOMM
MKFFILIEMHSFCCRFMGIYMYIFVCVCVCVCVCICLNHFIVHGYVNRDERN